ncbi:MAG: undecaprenyl/decaprenyl-phosphate alpha-N-acetylglucosaminyl 1-phosphate transferase [Candidatus Margulisbacteria bacterium]|nr:undecaprenyl/decaprenyl-phosphate alpha-N-acetylglucosaminyl 1-phosphate transferase [Candidatus Margulisiibacteriota bacterium]
MIKYKPVMLIYLLTFLLAFLVTYFATPVVKILASKINAVDIPNDRKVHLLPIPRLGGVAIYAGFMAAVGTAFILSRIYGSALDYRMGAGIVLAGTILMLVGMRDDIKSLRPTTKLVWQILAALIVISFGVEISFLTNPFNGILSIGILAIPLTLLWVVGITNAMNLIDGLDGLATGVTVISSLTLFFVALRTHQIGAAILMIALFGAALAFLRYNFNPASIFLGDSGSMFLGFILAASSIIGVLKTTLVVALIIPVLILGVPIFDTLFAIGRRLGTGKHPFEADNKHIHHMLLRAGFNKREAVLAIYIACFLLSFIALVMALQR